MFLLRPLLISTVIAWGMVLVLSEAIAFPPAPATIIHGLVRDDQGFMVDSAGAEIVFLSGGNELRRVALAQGEGLLAGENFRTLLPLDMEGGEDAYHGVVVHQTLPFTVRVEIAGQTFVPIETTIGFDAPDSPAAVLRLDLTVGVDIDGDGLPDSWEYRQLQAAGIQAGSADFRLDRLSPDGDADGDGLSNLSEYRAGTLAFATSSKLDGRPVKIHADGWIEIEFDAVLDKTYIFQTSTDTETWSGVNVGIAANRDTLHYTYRSPRTETVQFMVPPPAANRTFYRVTAN